MFNKIEYYKNYKLKKDVFNNELEIKINDKNKVLKNLKEEIFLKEEEYKKIKKLLNIVSDESNFF